MCEVVGQSHGKGKQTMDLWTGPDPAASFQALHSSDMIRPEERNHNPISEAESKADLGVLEAEVKTAVDDLQD